MAAVTPLCAPTLQRSRYESSLTSSDGRCDCRMRSESHCPAVTVQCASESPGCSFIDDKRSTKSFRHWAAEPELRVGHRADGAQRVQHRGLCKCGDEVCW